MPIDPRLLELLVCPACHGKLQQRDENGLTCAACRCAYPIRDGIPVLLVDQASPVEEPAQ